MFCFSLFNKKREPLSKEQLKALLDKAKANGDKEKMKEYEERLRALKMERAMQRMM